MNNLNRLNSLSMDSFVTALLMFIKLLVMLTSADEEIVKKFSKFFHFFHEKNFRHFWKKKKFLAFSLTFSFFPSWGLCRYKKYIYSLIFLDIKLFLNFQTQTLPLHHFMCKTFYIYFFYIFWYLSQTFPSHQKNYNK